jgi:O-methyltransferase
MTEPSQQDRTTDGRMAEPRFQESQRDGFNEWCLASLGDVRNNFKRANLIDENVRFIQGDVRKTLTQEELLPKKISVLRLDTDWYDTTSLELEILYPRLSAGGILIIDDYGHWAGAKKAVDEYFEKNCNRPFLQYTDYTCRMGVKYA